MAFFSRVFPAAWIWSTRSERISRVEITASPVEREFSAFFGGLEGAFVDVFQLGKGQLFLAVVEVASVRAGGGRSDQWFMVTKDVFVIQIKIIVTDTG